MITTAVNAIKNFVTTAWNNIKSTVSNVTSALTSTSSSSSTSKIGTSKSSTLSSYSSKGAQISASTNKASSYTELLKKLGIQVRASGGFVEDGLFFANHNELVGGFAGGKTAVANNQQITAGIEQATYNAMMKANADSNTREEQLLEELISAVKQGSRISIDGREIVTAYDSRKARNGYSFA